MIPFTTRFKRNSRVLKTTTLSNELTQNFKTNKHTDELKFTKPPLPHHKLVSFDFFFPHKDSSSGCLFSINSMFDKLRGLIYTPAP